MSKVHKIVICMGSSCFARGNAQHLAQLERALAQQGITARIELSGSRCEGKCASGPHIIIDGVLHSQVTEEKLPELIQKLIE